MPQPPSVTSWSNADYDAIAAAVVETARGRWFLAEHARRNRHADTKLILQAMEKIERTLSERMSGTVVDQMRVDLLAIANAIEQTKAEIAAIKPVGEGLGQISAASSEFDSIVETTEKSASNIIASAERFQEIAWTLREQGIDPALCDLLDAHATKTYTAYSFQEFTTQRIGKIVGLLKFLEGRINAMIRIWGLKDASSAAAAPEEEKNLPLISPAKPKSGLERTTVDKIIDFHPNNEIPNTDHNENVVGSESKTKKEISIQLAPASLTPNAEASRPVKKPEPVASPVAARRSLPPPDPIEKLTAIERLALFS
jgi:chemotaxis protein CheZ